MSMYLRVVGWEDMQHYKDRAPAWIKLYALWLEEYGFARLPDAAKWHFIGVCLLASKHADGLVPRDPDWIKARLSATEPIDLDAIEGAGLVELVDFDAPASNVLASCKQRARTEKRRGEKSRQDKEKRESRATEEDIALSEKMISRMSEVLEPSTLVDPSEWAKEIWELCQQGNTRAEIWDLWDWACGDEFWCTTIRSPAALWKSWDKILLQRRQSDKSEDVPVSRVKQLRSMCLDAGGRFRNSWDEQRLIRELVERTGLSERDIQARL